MPEGSTGDSARLETEEEGSGSAVVDPSVLSPEMDSSVEKVSSDPRSPRSICVPDAGLVRVFINLAVCFILLPTQQGSGALDPDEGPPASGEAKACTECHTSELEHFPLLSPPAKRLCWHGRELGRGERQRHIWVPTRLRRKLGL